MLTTDCDTYYVEVTFSRYERVSSSVMVDIPLAQLGYSADGFRALDEETQVRLATDWVSANPSHGDVIGKPDIDLYDTDDVSVKRTWSE